MNLNRIASMVTQMTSSEQQSQDDVIIPMW